MSKEPIAITGYGAVTPLGIGAEISWEQLIEGKSGITALPSDLIFEDLGVHVAARIPDFDPDTAAKEYAGVEHKRNRMIGPSSAIALTAMAEAMQMAGLSSENSVRINNDLDPNRVGVSLGTGAGGAQGFGDIYYLRNHHFIEEDGAIKQVKKRPSRETIFKVLPERIASIASMQTGAGGPLLPHTGACAAGNVAIYTAVQQIRAGEADIMIAGSAEYQVNELALSMFGTIGALDKSRNPEDASRPFNKTENGFVMAEGGGVLILESLKSAIKRKAEIYAVITGEASTGDGIFGTDTMMDISGPSRAMSRALKTTSSTKNIWLKAHATGTAGDKNEIEAVSRVLSPDQLLAISSLKGAFGHQVGGSGSAETVMGVMALRDGIIPHTLKLDDPVDEAKDWPLLANEQLEANVQTVLSCAYGFGGINAVIALEKYNPRVHKPN